MYFVCFDAKDENGPMKGVKENYGAQKVVRDAAKGISITTSPTDPPYKIEFDNEDEEKAANVGKAKPYYFIDLDHEQYNKRYDHVHDDVKDVLRQMTIFEQDERLRVLSVNKMKPARPEKAKIYEERRDKDKGMFDMQLYKHIWSLDEKQALSNFVQLLFKGR